MRTLSLSRRFFVVTLIALAPTVAIILTDIVALRRDRERQVHAESLQLAELAALEMERILSGTDSILHLIATTRVVRMNDIVECNALLARAVAALPQYATVSVFNADGTARCSSDPAAGAVVADDALFVEALTTDSRVLGRFTPAADGNPATLPVAVRFAPPSEPAAGGVVVAQLDLRWLGARIKERSYVEGNSLTIADRDGRIIAREPGPAKFVGSKIPEPFMQYVHGAEKGTVELMSQDGTRRIIGYIPSNVPPTGLYISAGISTERAFAGQQAATARALVIGLAGVIAALLLARYTSAYFIRRPFERLFGTINAWRSGDMSARTGLTPTDGEVGTAGQALDGFVDDLLLARAERQRAEQQRELLMQELDHRVKNLLAMVQVVARQSLQGQADKEVAAVLTARLAAMAGAHGLLMRDSEQVAAMTDLIRTAVSPFAPADLRQFRIEGPDLTINSRAAIVLAMALHELCTNAAKYGALSVADGLVTIDWHIHPGGAGTLTLVWTETGGPPVRLPSRRGFGSRMIETVLAGQLEGAARIEYPPDGLVCTVTAPLNNMTPDVSLRLDEGNSTQHVPPGHMASETADQAGRSVV